MIEDDGSLAPAGEILRDTRNDRDDVRTHNPKPRYVRQCRTIPGKPVT